MNEIKILLQDNELDIKEGFGFGLNYSVGDVKDPSKRSSSYSKTITLVGSKNNNKVLGGLFDVNADFTFFNPNFKTECSIVVNSTTVIRGYLKLISIEIENEAFVEGDSVEYKCLISSRTVDFFSIIKGKNLSDLDFSKYDHELTYSNILDSWDNTAKEVFTYPMLYKNSKNYVTEDFKLAIFEKAYLKRMALEAGYSLTGDLMDESTLEGAAFAKDIIPFNGGKPEITETERIRRKFKATTSTTQPIRSSTINNNNCWYPWTGMTAPAQRLEFHNDTTLPNFDNGGVFDETLDRYTWIPDRNGSYILNCVSDVEVQLLPPSNVTLASYTWNGLTAAVKSPLGGFGSANGTIDNTFRIAVGAYVNGVLRGAEEVSQDFVLPLTMLSGADPIYAATINYSNPSIYLLQGEVVEIKARALGAVYNSSLFLQYEETGNPYQTVDVPINVSVEDTVISNGVAGGFLVDGDVIEIESYIPKNIKQSDILTDIIKRYNAYISIDEDNEKLLRIETRDGYYARGGSLDWTNKKDYSEKDNIILLSELQKKEVKLSYAKGEDDFNKNYQKSLGGEVYGEKVIKYDNDFVTGVRKIESPFSPTALLYSDGSKAMIVPAIEVTTPKTNPRVIHYGGLKDCASGTNWDFTYVTAGYKATVTRTTYPYAGHYDDPINPTLDTNFGEVPFEYYHTKQQTTSANLYNRFWKNYIEQINEGRQITMYFNLNEVDISYIKDNLNTRIFVRDAYYFINKIIDYNPINKNTTKVELLKVKEAIQFVYDPKAIVDGSDGDYGGTGGTGTANGSSSGGITDSDNGLVDGVGTHVGTSSGGGIVVGDGNEVGNFSPNSVIVGQSNVVSARVANAFIIGTNGKTITEPNTGYIGETFYRNGLAATEETSFEFSDVISLRDAGTLSKGLDYLCSDLGLSFRATDNRTLDFTAKKSIVVPSSVMYSTYGVWLTNKDYSIDDLIVWGGMVWKCTAGGGGYSPVDDYTLNASFYELDTTESYYENITIDMKFNEVDELIYEASDSKGNVVKSVDNNLLFKSDWNDERIFNNITEGFLNNEVTELSGNICKIIKNNRNNGSITGNRNNGDIIENTSLSGTTMSITDNVNNGSIDYNRSTANVTINNNVNNGYIGTTTPTARATSITDTTVNK